MRLLVAALFFILNPILGHGQSLVLVNSGVNSGSNSVFSGSQAVHFSIGNASAVVPLRQERQLIHHGFEYPVRLQRGTPSIGFNVMPNPTDGLLRIAAYGLGEKYAEFHVTDGIGRLLYSAPLRKDLDLGSFSNGIYYLSFLVEGQKFSVVPVILSR
jgi:hypothetical protein